MHFCQAVTMWAISLAGFAESEIVEDGRCAAPLREPAVCAAAGYVENFHVFGQSADLVTRRRDGISAILRGWGLVVHEESDASPKAVLVGLELREGR